MHRSLAKKIIAWTIVLLLIVQLVAVIMDSLLLRLLSALVAVGIVLCVALPFANCPHCGSYMRANFLWTHYCPHCGEYLDD